MRTTILLALVAAAAMPLAAAPRLTYQVNGSPISLAWPAAAFPIPYAIDSRVTATVAPEAVDRAFNEWTNVPGTKIAFRPLGVRANLLAGHDGVNSVTMVDDLFKSTGFIAMTTWWDNAGTTTEADIEID